MVSKPLPFWMVAFLVLAFNFGVVAWYHIAMFVIDVRTHMEQEKQERADQAPTLQESRTVQPPPPAPVRRIDSRTINEPPPMERRAWE